MEMEGALKGLTTTLKPKRLISFRDLALLIDKAGFSHEVCSRDEFKAATNAVMRMIETDRGLFIGGLCGVGKTQLMRAIRRLPSKRPSVWIDCSDPEDVHTKLDNDSAYNRAMSINLFASNVYLDDYGADAIETKYGNKKDYTGDFICRYYSIGEGRLIMSSNLTAQDILETRGPRVLDRIKERCVIFTMQGESKRKMEEV